MKQQEQQQIKAIEIISTDEEKKYQQMKQQEQ